MQQNFSKQTIKERMMNRVQALWGIRNTELVDPVIKLLIESLASEVYRLAGELGSVETRILEKLASVMTPDSLLAAQPATSIIHVRTLDGETYITPDLSFSYRDERFAKQYDIKRIIFHPLNCIKSISGDVRYMIDASGVYELLPNLTKDILGYATDRSEGMNHSVWIGLDIEDGLQSLKNAVFYVSLRNYADSEKYISVIPHAKWSSGGQEIRVKQGFNEELNDALKVSKIFGAINRDRINRNRPYFVTVTDDKRVTEYRKEPFPKELANLFSQELVGRFITPILWLKVEFPAKMTPDVIRHLSICTNAVPVVNMSRKQMNVEINDYSTIIPLIKQPSEYFLGVESVTDMNGNTFRESALERGHNVTNGSYSIRRSGCERFNTNDARESIIRLIDALYDESCAFSSLEKEDMKDNLVKLRQDVNLLSRKLTKEDRETESTSYLVVDTDIDTSKLLTVSYWLTSAHLINDMVFINAFEDAEDLSIQKSSLRLLADIQGGKPSPNVSQKMDVYKYLLLSRDSIYSASDIENYCRAFYGEYIDKVTVSQGYGIGTLPGQGLIRIIEVGITPSKQFEDISQETFKNNLLNDLILRSPQTFNYRITIKA